MLRNAHTTHNAQTNSHPHSSTLITTTIITVVPMLCSEQRSARLQVVTRRQPDLPTAALRRRLPPPVVLVPQDGQHVALAEPQLLGDRRLVHVQRACYTPHTRLAPCP